MYTVFTLISAKAATCWCTSSRSCFSSPQKSWELPWGSVSCRLSGTDITRNTTSKWNTVLNIFNGRDLWRSTRLSSTPARSSGCDEILSLCWLNTDFSTLRLLIKPRLGKYRTLNFPSRNFQQNRRKYYSWPLYGVATWLLGVTISAYDIWYF